MSYRTLSFCFAHHQQWKKFAIKKWFFFFFTDEDKDFDPSADMLVHDFDDERTMEEEEALGSDESCAGELDDLQKVCQSV